MDTPYSLLVVDEVPSTQDLARSRLTPQRPAIVIAHAQTAGRGRSGAAWETAPRALAVSVAFTPDWPRDAWTVIPLCAGVAARRVLGDSVGLKWPNDVMVDDRKIGGILVEASDDTVVAGMGLNLFWPEPPSGAAALFSADPGRDRGPELGERWAAELLGIVGEPVERWPRVEYRRACVTLGRDITWEPSGAGKALDVAVDGSLLVRLPDGETTALSSGAVRHVR